MVMILSTIFLQMYGWLLFMIKEIVRYVIFVLLVIYEKLTFLHIGAHLFQ